MFEDSFFAVPAKGETDRLLQMARAALDAGCRVRRAARVEGRDLSGTECALAALTAGAVRIYEEICTLARLKAGRVFPSYDHLAQATALGRATGRVRVEGVTTWALLDRTSGRLLRVRPELAAPFLA